MNAPNAVDVVCTVRVEDGQVVTSYTFMMPEGPVRANTRMTADQAEGYRFMLARLIEQARGGVAPGKDAVDRMHGRYRLLACAQLPHEPPSDDDPARLEPMPMGEARALLEYIGRLELLARTFVDLIGEDPWNPPDSAGLMALESTAASARKLLGLSENK